MELCPVCTSRFPQLCVQRSSEATRSYTHPKNLDPQITLQSTTTRNLKKKCDVEENVC